MYQLHNEAFKSQLEKKKKKTISGISDTPSEVWEIPGANSGLLNIFTDSLKSSPLLHVEQDG